MQTDENAFIWSGRKFNSDRKICFIGDSFVENKFVDQGSRWFSYLEKLLLESGSRIQVLNAGYSGATSLNVLNTILNKIINNGIDEIYYCISSNDHSTLSYDQTYWNTTKNHSNLLLSEYDEAIKGDLKPDNFPKVIRSIYDVCRNFDVAIHFITYPNLCNNKALADINNLLRDTCQDFDYSLLDMDLLMQPHKVDFESLFHDNLHLNERGSELFAKIFFENYFLKYANINIYANTIITKYYKDLYENILSIEIKESTKKDYTSCSLIIDVLNQDLRKDKLLIQLESDNLKESEQDGFEFSEELGWHAFVNIYIYQAQIRYSFTLKSEYLWRLKLSLTNKGLLNDLIAGITLECY